MQWERGEVEGGGVLGFLSLSAFLLLKFNEMILFGCGGRYFIGGLSGLYIFVSWIDL